VSTISHHLAALIEAEAIVAVDERRVRGAIKKSYLLASEAKMPTIITASPRQVIANQSAH
jgi:hypothetical protein